MSNTSIELELTFLAKQIPKEIQGAVAVDMVDIYIPEDTSVHSKLRIRKKGSSYEITKKIPTLATDASKHEETTIELSEIEYAALANVSQKTVHKERYSLIFQETSMEVDIFKDELEGLVVIDFEFDTEQQMKDFIPPDFCLADITQENFIAGGVLAGRTYAEIEQELERFKYKKL